MPPQLNTTPVKCENAIPFKSPQNKSAVQGQIAPGLNATSPKSALPISAPDGAFDPGSAGIAREQLGHGEEEAAAELSLLFNSVERDQANEKLKAFKQGKKHPLEGGQGPSPERKRRRSIDSSGSSSAFSPPLSSPGSTQFSMDSSEDSLSPKALVREDSLDSILSGYSGSSTGSSSSERPLTENEIWMRDFYNNPRSNTDYNTSMGHN